MRSVGVVCFSQIADQIVRYVETTRWADFVAEVGFEGRIGRLMDFLKRMRDRRLSAGPRGAGALRL
jgi:hypothetical protein